MIAPASPPPCAPADNPRPAACYGLAVLEVVGWLADGLSGDEILERRPELTDGDIRSCLAYVADRLSND